MPKQKKEKIEPSIISQCPECRDIVMGGTDQYRFRIRPSMVLLGEKVSKVLCQGCIKKFQIE